MAFLGRVVRCYVCGSPIPSIDRECAGIKEEWLAGRTQNIYCQAAELETYITACHWSQLFRVIYRVPRLGKYCLSGIAQYAEFTMAYLVPRDREQGVIGPMFRSREHTVAIKLAPARCKQLLVRKKALVGYAVHSVCWRLVETIIGRCTVEKHLGILMKVLLQRFCELGFWTKKSLKSINSPGDPYKSKTIREIVMESLQSENRNIYPEVTLPSYRKQQRSSVVVGSRTHVSAKSQYCRAAKILPLEIQWTILDLLEMRDIVNMQKVVAWPIADAYWRSRVPRKVLFEAEEFPEDRLDWGQLCTSLTKLESSTSFDWFRNRQRVLNVIEGTKAMFERALSSSSD